MRPTLAELGLSSGKKARLHRILFEHGLRNGAGIFLPYDQGLEHGPRDFVARVKEKALGQDVVRSITPGQQIVKIFHDELVTLLGGDGEPLNLAKPARILVVGLNGAGKTTSCAKLAQLLRTKLNRQPAPCRSNAGTSPFRRRRDACPK